MPSISGWFKPSLRPQLVVARNRAFSWSEHFVDSSKRSVRCPGSECVLCGLYDLKAVGCIPVSALGAARVQLLRLPPSTAELRNQLLAMGPDALGQLIEVSLVSAQVSDGYQLILHGFEVATRVPCERYIGAIGVKAYSLCASALASNPELQLHVG